MTREEQHQNLLAKVRGIVDKDPSVLALFKAEPLLPIRKNNTVQAPNYMPFDKEDELQAQLKEARAEIEALKEENEELKVLERAKRRYAMSTFIGTNRI